MCFFIINNSLLLLLPLVLLTEVQADLKVRNLYCFDYIAAININETWNTLKAALDGQDLLQVQGVPSEYVLQLWKNRIESGELGPNYECAHYTMQLKPTSFCYNNKVMKLHRPLYDIALRSASNSRFIREVVAIFEVFSIRYQPTIIAFVSFMNLLSKDKIYDWVKQINIDSFQTGGQFPVVMMGSLPHNAAGLIELKDNLNAKTLIGEDRCDGRIIRKSCLVVFGLNKITVESTPMWKSRLMKYMKFPLYHQFEFTISFLEMDRYNLEMNVSTVHRAGGSGQKRGFSEPEPQTQENPSKRLALPTEPTSFKERFQGRERFASPYPSDTAVLTAVRQYKRSNADGAQLTHPIYAPHIRNDQQDGAFPLGVPSKWTQKGWISDENTDQPMPRRPTSRSRSTSPVTAGALGQLQSPLGDTTTEYNNISHFLGRDDIDTLFEENMLSTLSTNFDLASLSSRMSDSDIFDTSLFHVEKYDYNDGVHQTHVAALKQPGQAHGVPDPRLTFKIRVPRSPPSLHSSRVSPSRRSPGALGWNPSQLPLPPSHFPSSRSHPEEYDPSHLSAAEISADPAAVLDQLTDVPTRFTGSPYSYSPAQTTSHQDQQEQAHGYNPSSLARPTDHLDQQEQAYGYNPSSLARPTDHLDQQEQAYGYNPSSLARPTDHLDQQEQATARYHHGSPGAGSDEFLASVFE